MISRIRNWNPTRKSSCRLIRYRQRFALFAFGLSGPRSIRPFKSVIGGRFLTLRRLCHRADGVSIGEVDTVIVVPIAESVLEIAHEVCFGYCSEKMHTMVSGELGIGKPNVLQEHCAMLVDGRIIRGAQKAGSWTRRNRI